VSLVFSFVFYLNQLLLSLVYAAIRQSLSSVST